MQTQASDSATERDFQSKLTPAFDDALQDERAAVRRHRSNAAKLFERSTPLPGTLAELYLRSYSLPAHDVLRFHPEIWSSDHRRLPAIVAAASWRGAADVAGISATLFDPDTLQFVEKRSIGLTRGCAVYLQRPAHEMLIAENLEAALAAGNARGLPAMYAVLSLRTVSLPKPLHALTIAVDRGGRQLRDAAYLEAIFKHRARHVTDVRFAPPPAPFETWRAAARAGGVGVAA